MLINAGSAIGLIPARGGSKSIPRKNLVPLAGKPMIAYVIGAGAAARTLSSLVCSTDDDAIAAVCRASGVNTLERPADLARDETAVADVVRQVLTVLGDRDGAIPELVALLQPTSPFVTPAQIDACVATLLARPDADSSQTIAPVVHNSHAYNQRIVENGTVRFRFLEERRVAYNKQLKPAHFTFGNVVVSRAKSLLAGKDCFGDLSLPIVIPRVYAFDVDTVEDVAIATYLVEHGKVDGVS